MIQGVSVGSLTAFLGMDDSDFVRGIARAQASMLRLDRSMSAVGRNMTMSLTVPLLAIGGGAVKMAMDFEKVFSEIEGLVGVAHNQVEAFRSSVTQMAPDVGRGPQELAEAFRFVTSSGFKGAEALDIVEQSAKAAAAGLGETQAISDLVTASINAYGKENLTAEQSVNALTAAVREGKAEGEDMAHALGFVMPVASQMGVKFEEVSAAVAAMTRSMQSGSGGASTAATNLRQLLSDLLDPSERAKGALQEMGTSASELRRAIKEEGLLSVLHFFKEQLKTNEEAITSVFPNVRALTGVLQLVGENAEEVKQVFAELEDNTGDMSKAFAVASQSSTFKFNQSMAELKIAAIELGEALLPLFLEFVRTLRDAARWFSSLTDEGKKMVIIIGLVAAAIGPAMIVFGSMAAVFAAISIEVIAVVAALAALAGGIIYLYENWEAVKERVSDWGWWKNLIIDMAQFFVQYNPMTLGARLMLMAWNHMEKYVVAGINRLIDEYNLLSDKVGGHLGHIERFTSAAVMDVFELTDDPLGLESLKSATTEYKNEFGSFTEAIESFAERAKQALLNMFPSRGGGSRAAVSAGAPADGNTQGIPFKPEGTTWFGGEGDGPIYKMKQAVIDLKDALIDLSMVIVDQVAVAIESLAAGEFTWRGFFSGLLGAVADFAIQFGKSLLAAGIAALAFQNLLWNPVGAIAAGAALIIAGSVVKGLLKKGPGGSGAPQGLAVGGIVTSGGVFQLHKDELVSLPRGAAVTPAHLAQAGGESSGGTLKTSFGLRKLIIELDRERARMNR